MIFARLYKRKTNEGIIYYSDITLNGRRQRKRIGAFKRDEAREILDKRKEDLLSQRYGLGEPEQITLEDFCESFLEEKKKNTETPSYEPIEGVVEVHLKPFFGKSFLLEIDDAGVSKYQTERKKGGVTNATINREVTVLNNMLNLAASKKFKRLKKNPLSRLNDLLLKEPPGRLRYLTPEEIKRLLATCPDPPHPLRIIVIIALTTGMRKGEILSLEWNNVKMEDGLIILTKTKNNRTRIVPMSEIVSSLLAEMPRVSRFVFPGDDDDCHLGEIKRSFATACRKAGIKDFRFHDLRHTYASYMVMKGTHIRELQDLLGHADLRMTQRYSHLMPEYLERAAKRANEIVSGNSNGDGTITALEGKTKKGVIANPLKSLVGGKGVEPPTSGM